MRLTAFPPAAMAAGLALAAALATPAIVTAQTADPAVAPVRALSDGLLATMHAGRAAGFRGRVAQIGPVVDRTFDLPLMTRLAVGAGWTGVAPADQTALVAAFRRMTIARYAQNFASSSGEAFVVNPVAQTRGPDRLVRTQLTRPRGAPVELDYRLRQSGGQWRIIDVFYQNSISQLATQRSDFARIFASGGARALIAHIDDITARASR